MVDVKRTRVARHGVADAHDIGAVVVEDSGNVLGWEGVGGVGDEEAGLPDGAIAHNDTCEVPHAASVATHRAGGTHAGPRGRGASTHT